MLLYSDGRNLPYNSGSRYVNNSVQRLVVGGDIRVVLVLSLPEGASPMPHPPCAAFITGEIRFFDLRLGCGLMLMLHNLYC